MNDVRCRFCHSILTETFTDLGVSPPSNSYVTESKKNAGEICFPLHAYVCTECWLVQLEQFESPGDIFSDYLYFSSFSDEWLAHSEAYVAHVTERFGLTTQSQVVEIASNDGYLLQYFKQRGIPGLGVEPAANVAETAIGRGIETDVAFFGRAHAEVLTARGVAADLVVANNVMAHVPDINDFVSGLQRVLKSDGIITLEFPALDKLIADCQFDTIYHEHFSYLSLAVVERILGSHKLRVFDVQPLKTHGGSLRVFACHFDGPHQAQPGLHEQREVERMAGLEMIDTYRNFGARVIDLKFEILKFFIDARAAKKSVIGYGAPAKGNTLLNYCGIGPEMVEFTVDRSPHKQGKLLPGSHIPIFSPERIRERKPDYLLILPWNFSDEIVLQMADIREWGGKFVTFVPHVRVF